ncbi:hypothetical protein LSH36_117g01041 [Paralvinella palmiformis]|uniref:Major facilitator superfamily associated domain-containing protein n=1 Tax=Paralvinella palmiformis TaxID=53620 RepID=A0AAD9JYH7_9ANNE|nr:hypothetical protein LSH36_117g01041 [Paralvinella palmiformis]
MDYGSNTNTDENTSHDEPAPEENEAERGSGSTSPPLKETLRSVCSIEKKLVFYKLFYLTFCGAIGCVLPYVAVFLKQEGMGPEKIGIISGVRPIIGFISAPLFGMFGDSCGRRKCILLVSIVAWLTIYVSLYHVPAPARVTSCPANLVPHRERHFGHRIRRDSDALVDDGLAEPELPASEQELLQENLEWLYIPRHLDIVFIVTFFLIVGGEVFQAPTTALSDAGTLQTLGSKRLEDYGPQRAWGSIGWGISSFAAGALVSSSRRMEVLCGVKLYFSDYRLLTYIFIVFLVISFVAATQIKFKEGKDEEEIELKDTNKEKSEITKAKSDVSEKSHNAGAVIRIFFNVHYGSWLVTSFFVGMCNGVIWGFLYWHLDNLGASQFLMGVSGIVVCASEFVMFFLVGKVIKLLGHIGIMYLGLLGYTVRFCIYAVIRNPWWVLPAEILQGITFSIVWVSMTAYTTMAVPSASLATIQGILHGVYFGLGCGSGHLIGGIMIGYVGAVITFFSFAAASMFVLMLFFIVQKCSTKPEDVYGYEGLDEETDKTPASNTEQESSAMTSPEQ